MNVTDEAMILAWAIARFGARSMDGCALKLGEECGEVQGAVVKLAEGRASLADLDDELGDVLIVLSQLAALRGTTLNELRVKRMAKIAERPISTPAS